MKVYDIDSDSIFKIEDLIEVVQSGGTVRTGIDIFNYNDHRVIPGDQLINDVRVLNLTKSAGIKKIPIATNCDGGIWDKSGKSLISTFQKNYKKINSIDVEKQIEILIEQKKEAKKRIDVAKVAVKKLIQDIRSNGGRFEYNEVEETVVQLIDVINEKENPYALLARNIFSYDEYLMSHSINVCTIGTAVLYQINKFFKDFIIYGKRNKAAAKMLSSSTHGGKRDFYTQEEIKNISTGYFLHDIGKVAVPEKVLNKQGRFTEEEFELVKKHSYEYGKVLVKKNGIKNRLISDSVVYHHSMMYKGEENTYPEVKDHNMIPEYVKICKLSDIYDAMTSKRAYKDAISPAEVIAYLYKKYSYKCNYLQILLHAFMKSVGNLPPGTIVKLKNRQQAFVLDNQGPVIILITDKNGKKLTKIPDPINLSDLEMSGRFVIDHSCALVAPKDAYEVLPDFLKRMYEN